MPERDPEQALQAVGLTGHQLDECGTEGAGAESKWEVAQAAAALLAYFRGKAVPGWLKLDLRDMSHFARAVLLQCGAVGWGEVVSYGELAARVGKPKAARAVGQVLRRNPLAPIVPCHRVVGADGTLTGFGRGVGLKARLLEFEGRTVILSATGKWQVV